MRHRRTFTNQTEGMGSVEGGAVDPIGSSSYPKLVTLTTGSMKRCVSAIGLVGIAALSILTPGCAHEFDQDRPLPKRGSVGEEMFGVICDRVSAQALTEDLSGASFKNVCHRAPGGGDFANTVDESKLPAMDPGAVNEKGESVPLKKQQEDRKRAIGKIESLARRRMDLIRALDATFPEEKVAVKDLANEDPTKSCNPGKVREGLLTDQIADMLGKTADLYNDDTIPNATRSLATVMNAFKESPEAHAAWSRLSSRQGYRPTETGLGAVRPVVGYPNLRNFANASLSLLSADSKPYELEPKFDESGKRIPVPGPGNAALNKLLESAHHELLATKIEPLPGALVVRTDAQTGRSILSRPRDNIEMMQELLFSSDNAFGANGTPKYIVKRDARGYARISGGAMPAPFLDADNDGLPDIDDVGRFKTANNSLAPSPFAIPGAADVQRDELGRPLAGSALLYEYIDTSRTFAAQMMADLRPLVNPDPAAEHETLMDMMAGLPIAMGVRAPMAKEFASGKVEYDGVKDSPMTDLIYAMGAILGDKSADTTLQMTRDLVATKPNEVARVSGALGAAYDIAQKHPEAQIPREATLWDEKLDITVQIVREPGLLEDLLRALGDPATANLGFALGRYAAFKDDITYDRANINGPAFNATTNNTGEPRTPVDRTQPYTGTNKSMMFRFLKMVTDADGVTACNKEGARVHALGISLPLSFRECEVYKIDDLARFYLDSIADAQSLPSRVGESPAPGTIYMRPSLLRITPGVVGILQNSSGLTGMYPAGGNVVAPQPRFLNRLVFFDLKNDQSNPKTREWVYDLNGEFMGSSVCPERTIPDPSPDAIDARPDGMVRALRNCRGGQWIQQRNPNALFVLEHFGFYEAIRPLVRAFAAHKREDLFVALSRTLYKHYPDKDASPEDCLVAGGVACPRTGGVSYEGLLAEALATDILPALQVLAKELEVLPVKKCTAYDAQSNCTAFTQVSGIEVVAEATRAAIDPDYAKSIGLKDRRGGVTAKRNDGTTNPQVTPLYLILQALNGIDDAFSAFESQHPEDQGKRRSSWRRARSQMVDQFLGVNGSKATATWKSPAVPKMTPVVVDMLRAQLHAHCPQSFAPPYARCTWARDEIAKHADETMTGPLLASALGVMEAIQSDPASRHETNLLMSYLLDEASKNDALASVLASANDIVQMLRDDENLVPLFHVLATAVDATKRDANGKVVSASIIDAQTALLARLSGRYFDKDGKEICSKEIDPNQVLAIALAHLVQPVKDGDFKGQSPLEVIIDVIADVNRADPTLPYEGTLAKDDYAVVADNVIDFLTNKERGLEQFYEVIRNGTKF